jgi:hypothetical protein
LPVGGPGGCVKEARKSECSVVPVKVGLVISTSDRTMSLKPCQKRQTPSLLYKGAHKRNRHEGDFKP